MVYNRQIAINNILRAYKKPKGMPRNMQKLRQWILRTNKRARKPDDVIQDKYKAKLKMSKVVTVPDTLFISYNPNISTHLDELKETTFVLKPNHLSRGIGIRTLTKDGDRYRDICGDVLTKDDLLAEAQASYKQQRLSINCIKGIMAEQRLISHDDLQWYSASGIADIRMIFIKDQFTMGLGRFPTLASGEYGNMARGAKWGIFDSLGRFRHDDRFKSREIPNGKKLPFFAEMKETAQKVIESYGYVVQAVDMTVDKTGTVYVIESERTPQFELYLTKEGVDWLWGVIEGSSWGDRL